MLTAVKHHRGNILKARLQMVWRAKEQRTGSSCTVSVHTLESSSPNHGHRPQTREHIRTKKSPATIPNPCVSNLSKFLLARSGCMGHGRLGICVPEPLKIVMTMPILGGMERWKQREGGEGMAEFWGGPAFFREIVGEDIAKGGAEVHVAEGDGTPSVSLRR